MKNKTIHYAARLLNIIITTAFLTACSGDEPRYRIGVSQCSSDDWRTKMNEEMEREAMVHDDIALEIRSADDDNDRQIADLQYFLDNRFDIVLVSPREAEPLTPAIERLYDAGIPVIVYDRESASEKYTAFRGADNAETGRMAARMAQSLIPEGPINVLEIWGLRASTPARERHNGFAAEASLSPRMEIVAEGDGNWIDADSYAFARKALSTNAGINLIYAHNDRMALQARRAAEDLGIDVPVIIGIDGAPNIGVKGVQDGLIDATFIYPTDGDKLIATALDILEGRNVERTEFFPSAGAVTRMNADIVQMQNEQIAAETGKISRLKEQVDGFVVRQNQQRTILWCVVAFAILLALLIFVVLRAYWTNNRHRRDLDAKNHELQALYSALEQATQSKLVFFANVSHDLRTPLTLIADPLEQLSGAPNLTDRQQQLVALAEKNSHVLTRLINQILDFRKYENGRLELNLTEADFAADLKQWIDNFRMAALKKNINLRLDIDAPADKQQSYSMAFDAEKMERIIFNILSNAFKFTPDNGNITVRLSRRDNTVCLDITDDGRGMDPDTLRHIFERFYQTTTLNPTGSGIGLAVVKSFVELHGGTVEASSTEGKGTCFHIEIPVTHVEAQPRNESKPLLSAGDIEEELADIVPEAPDAEDTTADPDARTILVIDDNPDILTLVSSIFSDTCRVLTADNAVTGFRIAAKYIPDLIICDLMMPGVDGKEFVKRLKSEITTSHIPVMMLTACADGDQRIESYETGADAWLTKPFSSKLLRARAEALITNRRLVAKALLDPVKNPAAAATAAISPAETGKAHDAAIPSNLDSDFYRRFLELVEPRLPNPELSVEEIAADMGLSRVQFYRKIKALTNYSPVELLRLLRLRRADKLLKSTQQNVSEIAYAVGFSSPSYFTKCYRDHFGESPTDAQRRTSRNGNA